MKRALFPSVLLSALFFIHSTLSFGQICSNDSLLLKQFDAIGITDTLHSDVPKHIRLAIIEALRKRSYPPVKYYTMGRFEFNFRNGIHVVSVEALKFFIKHRDNQYFVGGAGVDDLEVIFDKERKSVLNVIISE
ncbi:MAG: hypothetical protein Q8909_12130 [Bacteroidota bacterium]|nr:hypothetical protein [Bacteroidota bacterium]